MAKITWDSFDTEDTNAIEEKYLPARGEGATMASQAVTAATKLIYKYFNDGDVFDNNHYLEGWANDISSHANWLEKHIEGAGEILSRIEEVETEDGYVEEILYPLYKLIFHKGLLEELEKSPAEDSVYDCGGPYSFNEEEDEYDEDEYDDEYDDYGNPYDDEDDDV